MNRWKIVVRFAVAIVAILSLGLSSRCAFAGETNQTEAVLKNADIIKLEEHNITDAVIINAIKESKCDFDVSVAGIIALSDAKVSSAVQQAMQATKAPAVVAEVKPVATVASPPVAPPIVVAAPDPNEPKAYHAAGVYLYEEIAGKGKMTKLQPETSRNVSSGGGYGGFGGHSTRAVVNGQQAKLQLKTRRPVFYMYLGRVDSGQLEGDKTPAEFPLIKFDTNAKKNTNERSIVVSSGGGGPFSSKESSGIDPAHLRDVKDDELSPGIYKVEPQDDLADGEYAFAQSTDGFARASGRMYCFGIRGE